MWLDQFLWGSFVHRQTVFCFISFVTFIFCVYRIDKKPVCIVISFADRLYLTYASYATTRILYLPNQLPDRLYLPSSNQYQSLLYSLTTCLCHSLWKVVTLLSLTLLSLTLLVHICRFKRALVWSFVSLRCVLAFSEENIVFLFTWM